MLGGFLERLVFWKEWNWKVALHACESNGLLPSLTAASGNGSRVSARFFSLSREFWARRFSLLETQGALQKPKIPALDQKGAFRERFNDSSERCSTNPRLKQLNWPFWLGSTLFLLFKAQTNEPPMKPAFSGPFHPPPWPPWDPGRLPPPRRAAPAKTCPSQPRAGKQRFLLGIFVWGN